MLRLHCRRHSGHCPISRRDVLYVGALAFGGLTLTDLLRLRATAATSAPRHKSVIMI